MIQAKVVEPTSPKKQFPKLMKHRDMNVIVLFMSEDTGAVLTTTANSAWCVGDYSSMFNPNNYTDFDGEITLKNQ